MGRAEEASAPATLTANHEAVRLAYLGRATEALAALSPSLSDAKGPSGDQAPASGLASGLEIAVLLDERETAAHLAPMLSGLVATQSLYFLHNVARHLGGAAKLLGERAAARGHYERALEWATSIRFRPEVALTRLQLAELLLDESQVSSPRSQGARRARARGTGNQELGTREEALAHLDFAIGEFQAMKMQPALARALRHKALLTA